MLVFFRMMGSTSVGCISKKCLTDLWTKAATKKGEHEVDILFQIYLAVQVGNVVMLFALNYSY